jgi:MFS family permease
VSIYIGATSVGCLLSGIMMDLWGRKSTVQIAVSCVCIGWLLIAISTTHPLMLVGIVGCGLGKGASIPGIVVSKKQRNTINMVKNVKRVDNETRT